MDKWNGIMKVISFEHLSKNGEILHKEENLLNILHYEGEELILKILFSGEVVPSNYYIGLDSRTSLQASSGIGSVYGYEPIANAYTRQAVQSSSFSVITTNSGNRQAKSPTLLFRAIGGSWGPVRNIFLANGLGYSNQVALISSTSLSRNITVEDGEIITMRMGMALSNC
jgi:hypothetical protein